MNLPTPKGVIELPTLYPHQEDLRDRTRTALGQHERVILTAPPGMGKTRTAKWILGASASREPDAGQTGKSLFTVHRRGLVDNASMSFSEDPQLPHGVVMSGVKPSYGAKIQVASIDTLLSWFVTDSKYDTNLTFDLIVFDEAHSHLQKLKKFLEHHDKFRAEQGLHPSYVIGLTATPQAQGLADIYREIVEGPPTQWLIDNNFLSPFRYFRATQGKLDLLKKSSTGDFTKKSEDAAMSGLAGDLVRDWLKFADGRPTVGFFPRRSHAKEAKAQLERVGLKVAYVDGKTEDLSRQRTYWELNNGKLDYLCNVQVVERGTDIPAIGCIQLCVAIGNVVRYCLDEDTEILTPDGWKGFGDDIQKCYQVTEQLECSIATPTGFIRRESRETMWGIEGRSLDICVTERHRMLIDKRRSGVQVCDSQDMPGEFKIPVACFEDSPGVPLTDDEIRFIGLVATYGNINTANWAITISQSDRHPECIEYIEQVLTGCGFRYGVYHRPFRGEVAGDIPERHPRHDYTISFGDPRRIDDRQLKGWMHLIPWVSKNVGESMADATREQLLVLLEAMNVGDGAKYKSHSIDWTPRTMHLAISNIEAAESLQSLCVRRGIRCNLTDNGCGCLCLRIDPSRQWWSATRGQADGRPCWGPRAAAQRVWCLEVPTGFIIARRNGKPFIVGNCQMIGRGSRPHPAKDSCLVLDHGGNIARHGFFEDERLWSLDRTTKDAGAIVTRPTIECPQCQAIYRGGKCKSCGYEPTTKQRKSQGLEFDGSELKEVKKRDRKVKTGRSAEQLMLEALYSAGQSRRTWKQAVGMFFGKNRKQGTNYRVPKTVTVGGHQYEMLRYDSPEGGFYVADLYPFTVERGNHGGKYEVK